MRTVACAGATCTSGKVAKAAKAVTITPTARTVARTRAEECARARIRSRVRSVRRAPRPVHPAENSFRSAERSRGASAPKLAADGTGGRDRRTSKSTTRASSSCRPAPVRRRGRTEHARRRRRRHRRARARLTRHGAVGELRPGGTRRLPDRSRRCVRPRRLPTAPIRSRRSSRWHMLLRESLEPSRRRRRAVDDAVVRGARRRAAHSRHRGTRVDRGRNPRLAERDRGSRSPQPGAVVDGSVSAASRSHGAGARRSATRLPRPRRTWCHRPRRRSSTRVADLLSGLPHPRPAGRPRPHAHPRRRRAIAMPALARSSRSRSCASRARPGAEHAVRGSPTPDELVVTKQFYRGFVDPALDASLRADGVTDVVIAGVYTHACVRETGARRVRASASDVYDRGRRGRRVTEPTARGARPGEWLERTPSPEPRSGVQARPEGTAHRAASDRHAGRGRHPRRAGRLVTGGASYWRGVVDEPLIARSRSPVHRCRPRLRRRGAGSPQAAPSRARRQQRRDRAGRRRSRRRRAALIRGAFSYAGQRCTAIRRFVVDDRSSITSSTTAAASSTSWWSAIRARRPRRRPVDLVGGTRSRRPWSASQPGFTRLRTHSARIRADGGCARRAGRAPSTSRRRGARRTATA